MFAADTAEGATERLYVRLDCMRQLMAVVDPALKETARYKEYAETVESMRESITWLTPSEMGTLLEFDHSKCSMGFCNLMGC